MKSVQKQAKYPNIYTNWLYNNLIIKNCYCIEDTLLNQATNCSVCFSDNNVDINGIIRVLIVV